METIKRLLQSRKFWVLLAALLGIVAALVYKQVDVWQALQAAIAALAVFSTGIAIEDAGAKAAGNFPG